MNSSQIGSSVALILTLVLGLAGTWWWQQSIVSLKHDEVHPVSWEQVKTDYPIPTESSEPAKLSPETAQAIVRMNPFSPKRHLGAPTPAGTSAPPDLSGTGAQDAGQVKFAYRGRINLGNRQRAIVEDTTVHKTYFLEVGQEVAGFKVLDIAENRVVLPNLQTNEELMVSLASTASP